MNAINSRNADRVNHCPNTASRLGFSLAVSRPTVGRLVQAGALAALSLASAACSSVAPPTQPVAPVSTGAAVCHPTSQAKVLARRVFVPGGVQASEQDGAFSVRFAADHSHCAAVDWASGTLRTEPGSCAAPAARTASRADDADETMLAWESHAAPEPHIAIGAVTYDAPRAFFGFGIAGDRRVVAHRFHVPAPRATGGETAPQLAAIGHDRFLLAWVDGDTESHHLRAQSVVGWGEPLGASMVLSPADASVIGQPSVVVAPTGYGLVTYVASIEGEFDVLATPISCAMN
jgi:hypothetical protein